MFEDIYKRLAEIFRKTDYIEFAYLFGSHARNAAFPFSDLDIAVYLHPSDISLNRELELHSFLSRELKSDSIDIVILNSAKNNILLEDIVRHGKVVYDGNKDLRESFELKVLHEAMDFKYQRRVFAGR